MKEAGVEKQTNCEIDWGEPPAKNENQSNDKLGRPATCKLFQRVRREWRETVLKVILPGAR